MKKVILFSLVVLIGLAACGNGEETTQPDERTVTLTHPTSDIVLMTNFDGNKIAEFPVGTIFKWMMDYTCPATLKHYYVLDCDGTIGYVNQKLAK
jgi:hypothetical protein